MNTDAVSYDLSPTYVGSEDLKLPEAIDGYAQKYVRDMYGWAFAIMVVMVIIIIALLIMKFTEKFNPGQSIRQAMMRDDTGGSGTNDPHGYRDENLDAAPPASYFATNVQDSAGNKVLVIDPNAKANQPGSAAWNILHSPDFNCNQRKAVGDDAWDWMTGVAKEKFGGVLDDNELSKINAGAL